MVIKPRVERATLVAILSCVALMTMSLIRTLIGLVPATLLAIPLYHFSIFDLGLPLVMFFANLLVMGWALGLMLAGLILRFGQSAESLAWLAVFLLAPFSAVYYPVTVLPPLLMSASTISLTPSKSHSSCGVIW